MVNYHGGIILWGRCGDRQQAGVGTGVLSLNHDERTRKEDPSLLRCQVNTLPFPVPSTRSWRHCYFRFLKKLRLGEICHLLKAPPTVKGQGTGMSEWTCPVPSCV